MSGEAAPLKSPKSSKNPADGPAGDPAEALPRRFGRLTLLRLMARGGMGEVFLATSGGIEGAERPCVVKIIRREHAEDKSFLARFLDEARIQAQLHHPGVAQILEAATDESGKPFVVVEHVEGRNLGEVRSRAQQLGAHVAWPEALALGILLAEGLAHVHERTDAAGRPLEIVHRDLSPQNVMLGYGGDVKLIDFGTARGENRRCHTVAGIVFAKPGYVAPEVANNTPGGVPADLYAFGIMVWELLAGRRFLSGEASEHMAAVGAGTRNPTPIAQLVDAPPELDAIISKLTATQVGDRYATAREALGDMVELMKRAPSLPNGERSVRGRIAQLMQRLYPAEPARSRADFARLVAHARKTKPRLILPPPSPTPPPASDDPSLLAGTRYRLLGEIGRGSMGVVYEACHVDLGRRVAVKVLSRDQVASAASSERFRGEARAIARIEHENLVRLFDFGFGSDGRAFYAMERLEGESLDLRLARSEPVEPLEVARIGVQACAALQAAHDAGVVHRDIKPANLFLTSQGVVKLLDFGVAKLERGIESSADHAEALVIVGTPEYMAPEQTRVGEADPRSDVYALGAVLYELVTGHLPHQAASAVLLLDAKKKALPESPRHRAPQRGIPMKLSETISRALEPSPEDRFQSAEEMREALDAAIREPELRRRRRRRIGFVFAGAVLAMMAAVGGLAVAKPEVRARAWAYAQPMLGKMSGASTPAPSTETAAATETAAELEEPAKAGEPTPGADQPEPQAAAEPTPAETDDEAAGEETADDPAPSTGAALAEPEAKDEPAKDQPKAAEAKKEDTAKADSKDDDMFSAQPVKAASGDGLEAELAKAAELLANGSKVKAFNAYRKIGKKHRKDPRALKAWSEAAAQLKGWGEALRVAKQWAALDKSVEARIYLAKMQRTCGKRDDAVKTLNLLLAERPGLDEARSMLKSLSPEPRVAQR